MSDQLSDDRAARAILQRIPTDAEPVLTCADGQDRRSVGLLRDEEAAGVLSLPTT